MVGAYFFKVGKNHLPKIHNCVDIFSRFDIDVMITSNRPLPCANFYLTNSSHIVESVDGSPDTYFLNFYSSCSHVCHRTALYSLRQTHSFPSSFSQVLSISCEPF